MARRCSGAPTPSRGALLRPPTLLKRPIGSAETPRMDSLTGPIILAVLVFFAIIALRRRESIDLPQVEARSVEDLIAAGRKIEAIKLYRQKQGVGLKEAKEAVDAMARGVPTL
jgi:hypothetical protein